MTGRRGRAPVLGLALLALAVPAPLAGHEVRPAYLELRPAPDAPRGTYEVTWKVPRLGDRVPDLRPELPPSCRPQTVRSTLVTPAAVVERWRVGCGAAGLAGTLTVHGLEATLIDVLVRIEGPAPAPARTGILRSGSPRLALGGGAAPGRPPAGVAAGYLRLGVEHIAGGLDHLLFVAALLGLVGGGRRLVEAITAFTVAHSITLGLATLGFVRVPGPPVEAVIALSILFLAVELVSRHRGVPALTARRPAVVAGAFGLLHGFGFAGALAEVGLPPAAIPPALLFFNLGVEAGQLAFVALLLAGRAAVQQISNHLPPARWPAWCGQLPGYGLGTVAAFWFFERLAAL